MNSKRNSLAVKRRTLFRGRKHIINISCSAPHHLTDSPAHRLAMLTALCSCAAATWLTADSGCLTTSWAHKRKTLRSLMWANLHPCSLTSCGFCFYHFYSINIRKSHRLLQYRWVATPHTCWNGKMNNESSLDPLLVLLQGKEKKFLFLLALCQLSCIYPKWPLGVSLKRPTCVPLKDNLLQRSAPGVLNTKHLCI